MAALELVKEIDELVIVTRDVSTSAGLDRLEKLTQTNLLMLE